MTESEAIEIVEKYEDLVASLTQSKGWRIGHSDEVVLGLGANNSLWLAWISVDGDEGDDGSVCGGSMSRWSVHILPADLESVAPVGLPSS